MIKRKAGGRITGLSGDAKPTAAAEPVNTIWDETDTDKKYYNTGSAWVPKSIEGSYKYIIFLEGSTYYCQDAKGKTVSSNASPVTVIQYGLDNLSAGRTWKEIVKLKGSFTFPTITVPSFTILDLTQARLLQTAATNNNFIKNNDFTNGNTDIEIVGGVIDGNKANQSAGGPENTQAMVHFEKCSNVMIHHGKHQNGDFANFYIKECPGPFIYTNNISWSPRHEHVSCHAMDSAVNVCRNYLIADNYFENATEGNTFVSTINVSDVVISNNTMERVYLGTSTIAVNGLRNIVVNNTISNGGYGIAVGQVDTSDYDASGSVIANNTVYNCDRYGIFVLAHTTQKDIVIVGNHVYANTTSTYAGIFTQGAKNVVIANNLVHDVRGSCINVTGSAAPFNADHVLVKNNVCFNGGQSSDANDSHRCGIVLDSSVLSRITNVIVEGNQCYDLQGRKDSEIWY